VYYLPWWMQWAQAIALIAISCLGSWIAYKQVRIGTAKLNLDLYEKRFSVFDAARKYLREFAMEGKITLDMLNAFVLGTGQTVFLFEDDVKDYIEHLRKITVSHRGLQVSLKSADNNEERRSEIAARMSEIESELAHAYPKLVELFKPYLKLQNI